jgi:hypothetical protein
MYSYLLPIGSVVKLKEAERLMMIFGVLQQNEKLEGKVFDYIGVPYPEGHYAASMHIAFDHSDIEDIIHRGYTDKVRDSFLSVLNIVGKSETQAKAE